MAYTMYSTHTPGPLFKGWHFIWRLLTRKSTQTALLAQTNIPHSSSMCQAHNPLFPRLISYFEKRIHIPPHIINELQDISKKNTVVYVCKDIGLMEYSALNKIFLSHNIPLIEYNNSVCMTRWQPWSEFRKQSQYAHAYWQHHSHAFDYIQNGNLPEYIARNHSVLLTMPSGSLSDNHIFFTGIKPMIMNLFAAQRLSDTPITIVPIDFLWQRTAKGDDHKVWDQFLNDQYALRSIRNTYAHLRKYKGHAQMIMGNTISLEDFLDTNKNQSDDIKVDQLRIALKESLHAQTWALTGPPVRPRQWFIDEVLSDEHLDRQLCEIAQTLNKSTQDCRKLAQKYISEIASNLDYFYLSLSDRLLNYVLKHTYEHIHIDMEGLKRIKSLYASQPIIFVPNHKSHMDYLILSHILYTHGMTVPHIAAGINLSFWPLGKLFRHCGAYFIRRRFRNNPLYTAVIETYLTVLLKQGYCQEFFIEGGRSRTGKLRSPKTGMVELLHNAGKRANLNDVCYIPVSLTYDRIIEQKSYISESQGKQKQAERPSHLLKLTRFLRRQSKQHGSVHIRFGNAIHMPTNNTTHAHDIATRICREINKHIVITPTACTAMSVLSHPTNALPLDQLATHIQQLLDFATYKKCPTSQFRELQNSNYTQVIGRLEQLRLVQHYPNAHTPFIFVDANKRQALSLYKNSIMHHFALMGLICTLFHKVYGAQTSVLMNTLIADITSYQPSLAHAFQFASRMSISEHISPVLNYLADKQCFNITTNEINTIQPNHPILCAFYQFTLPYIESLFLTCQALTTAGQQHINKNQLVETIQSTGNDMLKLGEIHYPESNNQFDIISALDALSNAHLIQKQQGPRGKARYKYQVNEKKISALHNLKVTLKKLL